MTTDIELLEAAAKAAGIVGEYRTENLCLNGDWVDVSAVFPDDELQGFWNPLTDDGDALRLAVRLGMELIIGKATTAAVKHGEAFAREANGGDTYSATRRAIVRAAAEMGKCK